MLAQGHLMSAFRRREGGAGCAPINASGVIQWFCDASRGPDAHYRRMAVAGAQRIPASGTIAGEGFRDVEAAPLRVGRVRTLIVQNAWKTPIEVDVSAVVDSRTRVAGDVIETPNLLGSLQMAAPQPHALAAGPRFTAPPYSIVRLRWTA